MSPSEEATRIRATVTFAKDPNAPAVVRRMRNRLRDVVVEEISSVEQGANQLADVILTKQRRGAVEKSILVSMAADASAGEAHLHGPLELPDGEIAPGTWRSGPGGGEDHDHTVTLASPLAVGETVTVQSSPGGPTPHQHAVTITARERGAVQQSRNTRLLARFAKAAAEGAITWDQLETILKEEDRLPMTFGEQVQDRRTDFLDSAFDERAHALMWTTFGILHSAEMNKEQLILQAVDAYAAAMHTDVPGLFNGQLSKGRMMPGRIWKGTALAALMTREIDSKVTDDRSRADVISAISTAAGISESTVNQIVNGSIDCPPLDRLEGIARALGTSMSSVLAAAERDGCEYGEREDVEQSRRLYVGQLAKGLTEFLTADSPPSFGDVQDRVAKLLPPGGVGGVTMFENATPEEREALGKMWKGAQAGTELEKATDVATRATAEVVRLRKVVAGGEDPEPDVHALLKGKTPEEQALLGPVLEHMTTEISKADTRTQAVVTALNKQTEDHQTVRLTELAKSFEALGTPVDEMVAELRKADDAGLLEFVTGQLQKANDVRLANGGFTELGVTGEADTVLLSKVGLGKGDTARQEADDRIEKRAVEIRKAAQGEDGGKGISKEEAYGRAGVEMPADLAIAAGMDVRH